MINKNLIPAGNFLFKSWIFMSKEEWSILQNLASASGLPTSKYLASLVLAENYRKNNL
jgi:hypothetical protein